VPVGIQPFAITVNPAGTFAYVNNLGNSITLTSTISVINLSSYTVVGPLTSAMKVLQNS